MITLRDMLHLDDDSTATFNNHGVFMKDRQVEKVGTEAASRHIQLKRHFPMLLGIATKSFRP